ncbi:hypothetical protein CH369_17995 [Leptospira levettii]|uniref:hypothetical protein n=1 Tax=Leptospira levettii TaxID=2023178 RepID=UPI000C2A910A|nr:hypothetical protein [Leptospira levettii]PJZ98857.1 hypothetical protein CH369_17995 [Leptospira levettii]
MDTNQIKQLYLEQLPVGIQELSPEIIILPKYVTYDIKKQKVIKKPLNYAKFIDIRENFTNTYLERLIQKTNHIPHIQKEIIEGEYNIGIMLEFSDILVIDCDSYIDETGNRVIGTDIIYDLDSYRFKNEKIQNYVSMLFEIISNNRSYKVDTGSGEHYYFRCPRELYNSRSIKSLDLVSIFKDEDLDSNPFVYNGKEYHSLEEISKIKNTIDILASGYVIAPPTQFFDRKNKSKILKTYTLNKRISSYDSLPELDFGMLKTLFDLTPKKKGKKGKKKKIITEQELIYNDFAPLDNVTIDEIQGNQEYEAIIDLDDELQGFFQEYLETKSPKSIAKFELHKQILIENSYYNSTPLSFLTAQKQRKIQSMNNYVKSKSMRRYFINSPILDKVEDPNYNSSDKSKFEYAYQSREIALGTPLAILQNRKFSENARMKDKEWIEQAHNKLEEDFVIDPNTTIGKFNRLILQARQTNFSTYYGKAQHSTKLVYMYLLTLASGRLDFVIRYESTKTISLGSTVSCRNIYPTLDRMEARGWITVNYKELDFKGNKERKAKYIESITIHEIETEIDPKIDLNNSHTSFDFEELVFISEIGKNGATIYQSLLKNGEMTLKEIYAIFPNLKNKTTSIKPRIQKMLDYKFILFDEETKTYRVNPMDIQLNLINAKKLEHENRISRNAKKKKELVIDTVEHRIAKFELEKQYWENNKPYLVKTA